MKKPVPSTHAYPSSTESTHVPGHTRADSPGSPLDAPIGKPRGKTKAPRIESLARRRIRLAKIIHQLRLEYPEAGCALEHGDPFQLLVATILSAQCTDDRVNQVTPALFKKYPDVAAFANANPAELEQEIHSTGFFRNKARNIIACSRLLLEEFESTVPQEMDRLVTLPGVGRKTANVVRGACFSLPAITVDTHCGRISRKLGLTANLDPDKVESDLAELMPKEDWWFFSSAIIWHGRRVCAARRPACFRCTLAPVCPSAEVQP